MPEKDVENEQTHHIELTIPKTTYLQNIFLDKTHKKMYPMTSVSMTTEG